MHSISSTLCNFVILIVFPVIFHSFFLHQNRQFSDCYAAFTHNIMHYKQSVSERITGVMKVVMFSNLGQLQGYRLLNLKVTTVSYIVLKVKGNRVL